MIVTILWKVKERWMSIRIALKMDLIVDESLRLTLADFLSVAGRRIRQAS
jgi:hypothetical protein